MNKTRVLLVDDDPGFTDPMCDLLHRLAGFETMAEHHPERAVAVARFFQPDIILLDLNMPLMHGVEVKEQIRQVHSLRKTPIVYLTELKTENDPKNKDPVEAKIHRIPKYTDANRVIQVINEQLTLATARDIQRDDLP
jgi:CheY-like chemotaxis protein